MDLDQYNYDYGKDTLYCYPNTSVLKNKLNIKDDKELEITEKEITFLRDTELENHPLPGDLNFDYFKTIHKYLFGEIYDWAGQIRKVDISKGNTFCLHDYIEVNADAVFNELRNENYLLNLDRETLVDRITYYLGEFNAIHPFREGNGRTQRRFLCELASRAGYYLDFSDVSRKDMIIASDAAFHHEYELLRKIINSSLKDK